MLKYFAFALGSDQWMQVDPRTPKTPLYLVKDLEVLKANALLIDTFLKERYAAWCKEIAPIGLRVYGLDIHLTHGCNLACAYCYQGDHQAKAECATIEMVRSALKKALDKFPAKGKRPFKVKISGGEPTLFPEMVAQIVTLCRDLSFTGGVSIEITLETNGMMLDRVASVLPLIDILDISFDGVVHDEYRVTHAGKGTLQTVMDQLQKYRDIFKGGWHLNLVVTQPGLKRLKESLDLAWGVIPSAVIRIVKSADMFWNHQQNPLARSEYNKIVLEVFLGLSEGQKKQVELHVLRMDVWSRTLACCGISGGQWVLLPDGTITTTPQAIGPHERDKEMRARTLIATWDGLDHQLCPENWENVRRLSLLGQVNNACVASQCPVIFFGSELSCVARDHRQTGSFDKQVCPAEDCAVETALILPLHKPVNIEDT